MAANVQPIYTLTPNVKWTAVDGDGGTAGPLKTANTAFDGTGTVTTIFTAGAAGSYVKRLRVKAAGTNVASVVRIFVNNGATNATAGNNSLIDEISMAATTSSATTALQLWEISLEFALNATYRMYATVGTTISAGVWVTVLGGDY